MRTYRTPLTRNRILPLVILMGVILGLAIPATAIVYGTLDGTNHPNVGSLLFDFDEDGVLDQLCSGTLVSPTVYVTASHCTEFFDFVEVEPGEVPVTFDSVIGTNPTIFWGTHHTHPEFGFSGPGGRSDPHDVAVVVFATPIPGIAPAQLPTAGLLDQLSESHELRDMRFTAVGYGAVRETNKKAHQSLLPGGERRYADQGFLSLTKAWLNLSMNLSTGNAGTCYGDSGGPHFLGAGANETNIVVSVTVTGDVWCKATDVTYRLDTASARSFLDDYLTLP
jgi:hypothetical protein